MTRRSRPSLPSSNNRHPDVATQILSVLTLRATIFSTVRRRVPCPLPVLLETLTDLVIDRQICRLGTGGQTYFSLPTPNEYQGPPVIRVPVPTFKRADLEHFLTRLFIENDRTFGVPELYLRARSHMPQVQEAMVTVILRRWVRAGLVAEVPVAWQTRYRRL